MRSFRHNWGCLDRVHILIAGLSFFIAACGLNARFPQSGSAIKTLVPGNFYDLGRLGLGYDSLSGRFGSSSCVTGEVVNVGGGSARLDYLQNLDVSQLTKKLSVTLGWSVPFMAFSPDFEFVKTSAATKLSNTHAVLLQMKSKSQVLKGESLALSASGQALLGAKAGAVYAACGNEFVSRIDYGGALLATLKIEFSSQDDKSEFDTKASLTVETGAGPATVNAGFSKLSERMKLRTRVVVSAQQFGGQPSGLLQIMPPGVASCTLDAASECVTLFENVVNYSRSGFTEQFSSPEDYVPVNYQTSLYTEQTLLQAELQWPTMDGLRVQNLQEMGKSSQRNTTDHLKAQKILGMYENLLSSEKVSEVRVVAQQTQFNLVRIAEQMALCLDHVVSLASVPDSVPPESVECAHPPLEAYDARLLDQKLQEVLVRRTFTLALPLEGLEVLGSRPKNIVISQDVSLGLLGLKLNPPRFQNCEREEFIHLRIPVQVAESGVFRILARVEFGACPKCAAAASLTVNELRYPVTWVEAMSDQKVKVNLHSGSHVLGLRVSGKGICGGQALSFLLKEFRLVRLIEPPWIFQREGA